LKVVEMADGQVDQSLVDLGLMAVVALGGKTS